jgi:hypothetical protein
MVLKRSRVKRLDAGRWKGKSYPERANPNLGREYNTCSDRACGSFGWAEPQTVGAPEANQKQATTPPARKPLAKGQTTESLTEGAMRADRERRARELSQVVARSEAEAEKLRVEYPTVAEQHAARRVAAGAEAKGLAEIAAREAANLKKAQAEAERIRLKQIAAHAKALAEAEAPMEVDAVRAMFAAPAG